MNFCQETNRQALIHLLQLQNGTAKMNDFYLVRKSQSHKINLQLRTEAISKFLQQYNQKALKQSLQQMVRCSYFPIEIWFSLFFFFSFVTINNQNIEGEKEGKIFIGKWEHLAIYFAVPINSCLLKDLLLEPMKTLSTQNVRKQFTKNSKQQQFQTSFEDLKRQSKKYD